MNYYKISYSVNDKNERVYPKKMKDVVFVLTQDHPHDLHMIGGTESKIDTGRGIVGLTAEEAESLINEYQASFQKMAQPIELASDIPPPPNLSD